MAEPEERAPAYEAVATGEGYEVRRDNGRVVMVCGDQGSAAQYAVMLNEAFDIGFKSGYRAARRA
jgi:hypothetical protein